MSASMGGCSSLFINSNTVVRLKDSIGGDWRTALGTCSVLLGRLEVFMGLTWE